MKKKYFLLITFFLLFFLACQDDNVEEIIENPPIETPDNPEEDQTISLNKTTLQLGIGERSLLIPTLKEGDEMVEISNYTWSIDNNAVTILHEKEDKTISIIGMNAGTAVLTIQSADQKINASCEIEVAPKTIKVLAIGNSFSEDAVQNYLYQIAQAAGFELIIGNMYIGGCDLQTHWNNTVADAGAYSYRKIVNGSMTTKSNTSVRTALTDESWHYVSVQQASPKSGLYATYEGPLPSLISYIQSYSDATLLLHQTWAYSTSYVKGFNDYAGDQLVMYDAIVDAVWRAAELVDIDLIIPAGTAIQNARTSYLGDTFCRDGYHLEVNYGRYTASSTWFEQIFNTSVVGNSYAPVNISAYNRMLAQHAAHYAVMNPKQITDMVEFKEGPEPDPDPEDKENNEVLNSPVLIEFGNGNNTSSAPWNNVTSVTAMSPYKLYDTKGTETGILIRLSSEFGGINAAGPSSTNTILNMPSTASNDSFWGNTGAAFEGKNIPEAGFIISSLNKNMKYRLTFFSGRNASDKRETRFIIQGRGEKEILDLEPCGNTTETVITGAITPDENGRVNITVTSGPNGNDVNGFYYINAMSIEPANE